MGKLVRCISDDGCVSVIACDTTDIAVRAHEIHSTSNVCSAALGRALTAAVMMGAMLKSPSDSITLKLAGGGEAGTVMAVTDGALHIKGWMANPSVDLPLKENGHLDVGGAVGRDGFITVIKDLGLRAPFIGQVPLVSGEIAEDVTSYYAVSEQVPTVCGLGVLVSSHQDTYGQIITSGGYMIQLLPTADDGIITKVEKGLAGLKSVTEMLTGGMTPLEICKAVLPEFEVGQLDEYDPVYHCDCSRERVERALISTGKQALIEMSRDDSTEIKCHFCGKSYRFTGGELLALADTL